MEIIVFLLDKILFPILVGITLFILQKFYDEKNLSISGITSAIKNHSQKILDITIGFIIPIAFCVMVNIYIDFGKIYVLCMILFFMYLVTINIYRLTKIIYYNDNLIVQEFADQGKYFQESIDRIMEYQGTIRKQIQSNAELTSGIIDVISPKKK